MTCSLVSSLAASRLIVRGLVERSVVVGIVKTPRRKQIRGWRETHLSPESDPCFFEKHVAGSPRNSPPAQAGWSFYSTNKDRMQLLFSFSFAWREFLVKERPFRAAKRKPSTLVMLSRNDNAQKFPKSFVSVYVIGSEVGGSLCDRGHSRNIPAPFPAPGRLKEFCPRSPLN